MSVVKRFMVSRRPVVLRPAPERKVCNYMHRVCLQSRVEGYEYCIRHVLEDKTAPFRQCAFTHAQSGRRCSNAAPKTDKRESLCQWHAKKALQHRRNSSRKQTLIETPHKILESLEHHCRDPQHSTEQSEIARNTIKFYDADSDQEAPSVQECWHPGDSDSDSVDNSEDPLRHAGVYTAEEAAVITRDKLIRLQSLYLEQLKRLNHVLKERRRDYLRRRRETPGISKEPRTPQEETLYRRFKAYYRYHREYGVEAVLRKRFRERQTGEPVRERCSHSDTTGEQCTRNVLPLSKFCRSHILDDKKQLLFEKCDAWEGDSQCPTPLFAVDGCLLHTQAPPEDVTPPAAPQEDDFHFQSMDDIAALGLDVVQPGSLFGLNQFGDPGESTDSALSDDDGMMAMDNDLLSNVPK
ncbi:KAT8 regulatory NSL complex subunit 2-like [Ornithodoros turicata]|uniref:KAT8 regulatory NSL complex subunit 2-like n=1 Tax=Ornithodoros turicata TaxID=34597 RepID=UPI003139E5F6